jgi:hypothetical protein
VLDGSGLARVALARGLTCIDMKTSGLGERQV